MVVKDREILREAFWVLMMRFKEALCRNSNCSLTLYDNSDSNSSPS